MAVAAFAAIAPSQTFTPINNSAAEMYLSSNGLTVVGNQGTRGTGSYAWMWRSDTKQFWTDTVSNVYCVSGNGLVVGGDNTDNELTVYYPFSGTPIHPGIVPSALSTDGQTMFGYINEGLRDFVYTPSNGPTPIYSTNYPEYPSCCSGDGTILYGFEQSSNPTETWLWTKANGVSDIGAFQPYNCSLDGQTVVGVDSLANMGNVLDIWNTATGLKQVALPGPLDAVSYNPVSITSDGTTVWGTYADSRSAPHAFLWNSGILTDLGPDTGFFDERGQRGGLRLPGYWKNGQIVHYGFYEIGSGWVDITSALIANGQKLTGWSNLQVQAISDDGTKMCGFGTGPNGNQAFFIEFPADFLLSVASTTVFSGNQVTATLTLPAQAGLNGLTVGLSSSNAAATVPPTVTMPAGQASVTFPVGTGQVSQATPVTLTATSGNASATTQITVEPPTVSALTISPSPVTGGTGATGTVQLTGPVLKPLRVTLYSDSPFVSVQSLVVVKAGASTATFPINTTQVSVATVATVTEQVGAITATGSVTLGPANLASLSFVSSSVVGGNDAVGIVTLTGPAGYSGDVVKTATDSPAAIVRGSVSIAAGTEGPVYFRIETKPVQAPTNVTVTVTLGTSTLSQTLMLTP
jgi:hypothetical protein